MEEEAKLTIARSEDGSLGPMVKVMIFIPGCGRASVWMMPEQFGLAVTGMTEVSAHQAQWKPDGGYVPSLVAEIDELKRKNAELRVELASVSEDRDSQRARNDDLNAKYQQLCEETSSRVVSLRDGLAEALLAVQQLKG